MDRLRCLEIFAEVARAGSFSAAAQRFASSGSSLVKQVVGLAAASAPIAASAPSQDP